MSASKFWGRWSITTTKIKWKESGPLLKWDVIYASVFLEVRKKRHQHQILEFDQHVYFNDPTVGKVPLSLSHCIGHLWSSDDTGGCVSWLNWRAATVTAAFQLIRRPRQSPAAVVLAAKAGPNHRGRYPLLGNRTPAIFEDLFHNAKHVFFQHVSLLGSNKQL